MSNNFVTLLRAQLKRPSQFVRNVGTTVISQVLLLVLSTINAAIMARLLGAEGKGILQLVILLPSMLGLFLSSGIGVAIVHFIGTKRFDIATMTAHAVSFTLLFTLCGGVIVAVFLTTGWIEALIPGAPVWLLSIALMGFPLNMLQGYLNAILQGLQEIYLLNLLSVIQGCTVLILTVVFVILLGQGVLGAVGASLFAGGFMLVLRYMMLRRRGAVLVPRWNREVMRTMWLFGLRGHVGNILQFFNYRLDVFIVNFLLGPASVGIYGVGTKLAELVWYFPNAVSFVIFPKAAATAASAMNRFTPRIFRITLIVSALAGVAIALIGEPFITIVYTNAFGAAYWPMLALLPGVVLLGSARVLTNDIAGRGYPQFNSINAGLALVLTVVFDLLLIPKLGILGAGVASSIAYTLTFVSALLFYRIVSHRAGAVQEAEPEEGAVV